MPYTVTAKVSTDLSNQAKFGTDGGLHVPWTPLVIAKFIDDSTTITTGTSKYSFVLPFQMTGTWNLSRMDIFTGTLGTSGSVTVVANGTTYSGSTLSYGIASTTLTTGGTVWGTAGGTGAAFGAYAVRALSAGWLISLDVSATSTNAKGLGASMQFVKAS